MDKEMEGIGFVFLHRDVLGWYRQHQHGFLPNPNTLQCQGFDFFGSTAKQDSNRPKNLGDLDFPSKESMGTFYNCD